jgi:hypothetical protein
MRDKKEGRKFRANEPIPFFFTPFKYPFRYPFQVDKAPFRAIPPTKSTTTLQAESTTHLDVMAKTAE